MYVGEERESWGIKKYFLIILCVLMIAVIPSYSGKRRAIAGIPTPVQKQASGSEMLTLKGYNVKLTFLYSYDIEALVVHKKSYNSSSLQDKLVPVDVALAWGKVAQYNKDIDFHWSQSGRWVFWRVNSDSELDLVGGENAIVSQSSNNHLIPANKYIEKKVKKIKKGDHIRIKGYLVNVHATKSDGSWWSVDSSTSREDSGGGACEVIYVTDVYKIS